MEAHDPAPATDPGDPAPADLPRQVRPGRSRIFVTIAAVLVAASVIAALAAFVHRDPKRAAVPPLTRSSKIAHLAGNGVQGAAGDGSSAAEAELAGPAGLAVDRAGRLYVTSTAHRIRRIDLGSGVIETVAGNGKLDGGLGDGGPAGSAQVQPEGLTIGADGNLYISDAGYHRVRVVDARTGSISTIAGNGTAGSSGDGGPASSASIDPAGLAVSAEGDVFVADRAGHCVRVIRHGTGIIETVAGQCGSSGPVTEHAVATQSLLGEPFAVILTSAGDLVFSDVANHRVLVVDHATGTLSTLAGNGSKGDSGDGGPASRASVSEVYAMALDPAGTLFLCDSGNNQIRAIDPRSGTIRSIAGVARRGYSGDGGPAGKASMWEPDGVAWYRGKLYVSDTFNSVVRVIG